MQKQRHFFIGKGGVGKSTVSSLFSTEKALKGKKTLLVSMDPAHNQSDIFKRKFSQKVTEIDDCLDVIEVDEKYWKEKYLNETEEDIKSNYSYESAFNLSKYFNVLRYSPGIEEHALILGYVDVLNNHKGYDYYIFDMPPTALTIKFFLLPSVSMLWLEELLNLRNKILEKKEIISKVKFGKKEIERDKIKNKLNILLERYKKINKNFKNENTNINMILNCDMLSLRESKRMEKKLNSVDLKLNRIIINKVKKQDYAREIKKEFKHDKVSIYKYSDIQLIGYNKLKRYLEKYEVVRI
ncbi:MAG: ArsA family ATPase [Thermotogota bacterium]|nr:ArsA family ATPase [Thermotogota bacterium]